MWNYREQSLAALEGALRDEAALIRDGLDLVNTCIKLLAAEPQDGPYARIYALILVKAKHFAFACFTLTLDGLSQESGALLRLWIEAIELLHYLNADPAPPGRFEEFWLRKLPSAGNIAKAIGGHFQSLRSQLSSTASHFSVTPDAMRHLVDPITGEIREEQRFSLGVVRTNLQTNFYFLYFLSVEALVALKRVGVPHESLESQLQELLTSAQNLFSTPASAG